MSTQKTWTTQLIDARDGSGDAILELPDEVVAQLGWNEGDVVKVTTRKNGKEIWIRKGNYETPHSL